VRIRRDVNAPSLDRLAENPGLVMELPGNVRAVLLARAMAVIGALSAPAVANGPAAPVEDRLLDVRETARRLAVSPDYVYRHHPEWPFTVRRGRKIGFSERGLGVYLEQRQNSLTGDST
jgi:hypothetical protein